MDTVASRLEAIAFRLEAIASKLEDIVIRGRPLLLVLEAIAFRLNTVARLLEAIAFRLEAIASQSSNRQNLEVVGFLRPLAEDLRITGKTGSAKVWPGRCLPSLLFATL